MVACTYFYICNSSIMFVYYINFSYKEKRYCFLGGTSVPSLIFLLVVILRVHATVLCWEVKIRSAQHTRLPACCQCRCKISTKYFSSTKGRAPDAACSHYNVLVLYRTRTI